MSAAKTLVIFKSVYHHTYGNSGMGLSNENWPARGSRPSASFIAEASTVGVLSGSPRASTGGIQMIAIWLSGPFQPRRSLQVPRGFWLARF